MLESKIHNYTFLVRLLQLSFPVYTALHIALYYLENDPIERQTNFIALAVPSSSSSNIITITHIAGIERKITEFRWNSKQNTWNIILTLDRWNYGSFMDVQFNPPRIDGFQHKQLQWRISTLKQTFYAWLDCKRYGVEYERTEEEFLCLFDEFNQQ